MLCKQYQAMFLSCSTVMNFSMHFMVFFLLKLKLVKDNDFSIKAVLMGFTLNRILAVAGQEEGWAAKSICHISLMN